MLSMAKKRYIELYNESIEFSSVCRCPAWNKHEGGSRTSSHLTTEKKQCKAADVICRTSKKRYRLMAVLHEVGFRRFGVARTFLHTDIDDKKASPIIFVY